MVDAREIAVTAQGQCIRPVEHGPASNPLLHVDLVGRADAAAAHLVAARFLTGYTGHTLRAYRRDLEDYFTWCEDHDVAVLQARRVTVDAYARHLADPARTHLDAAGRPVRDRRPASPATVARRLTTLSGFYRYAVDEEAITRSPLTGVRRPRLGNDSPSLGLDQNEARRLLHAARDHSPRAHALTNLLLFAGLRINEALGADVTDLTTVRGHRTLQVRRKGGARHQIALNAPTVDALDTYLAGRTDGPLFNTRTGGRFDPAEAWRLIRRLATDAHLDSAARVNPHSLRHTFVTLAREAGVPLEDVQDAAGHADPRTTRRYDRGRHNLDRSPAYALATLLARH